MELNFSNELRELERAMKAQALESTTSISSERDSLMARIASLEDEHDKKLSRRARSCALKAKERGFAEIDSKIETRLKEEQAKMEAKLASQIEELRSRTDADVAAAQKALADARASTSRGRRAQGGARKGTRRGERRRGERRSASSFEDFDAPNREQGGFAKAEDDAKANTSPNCRRLRQKLPPSNQSWLDWKRRTLKI